MEQKILDVQHEHPSEKKDIFKAIFDDSSDDENDSPIQITESLTSIHSEKISGQFLLPPEKEKINVLRNTSPPRGIFANLLSRETNTTNKNSENELTKIIGPIDILPDSYGPVLPPIFKSSSTTSLEKDKKIDATLSKLITLNSEIIIEEKWIEKESKSSSDHKKKKHGDKHKKKHKKEHKKYKRKDRKKSKHH